MIAVEEFARHFPDLADEFFLKDFQTEVIEAVVEQNSTLCIMPTGGGKSLIYWVSARALGGTCIVISPLTALIDEQAAKLEEQGQGVLVLHSGIDKNRQLKALQDLFLGVWKPDFIFVSPERLATDGLVEHALKKCKEVIKLVVIDEAHCISQWGHSFRPFYTHIPSFLDEVFQNEWPTILALSATLNAQEVSDIRDSFDIQSIKKDDLLMRTEIQLHIKSFLLEEEKEEKMWQLLQMHKSEKTLVYLYRRSGKRSVESFAEEAIKRGFKATYFHSEVSSQEKQNIIERFKNDELELVFATNAFGMGIDIKDIRVVIHYMLPESISQYYQEIGRASRDQQSSHAYLLYTEKNISVKRTHFIDKSFPTEEELKESFVGMINNRSTFTSLDYFDNEVQQKCLPYFINQDCLHIAAKGIQSLEVLEDVQDPQLEQYLSLTNTKIFIRTMNKANITAKELSNAIFESILAGRTKVRKSLRKCLIIESLVPSIEPYLNKMLNKQAEQKQFKHQQLDYFVYQLHHCMDSRELHQEIGKYLGVPRFKLNCIYSTTKGDRVRSKSEVIIANALHARGITYDYEKTLTTPKGERMSPDFTLYVNGETYYLEHLGMIGVENYDERWIAKKALYEAYYKDQLLYTYESTVLSTTIITLIDKLKSGAL